MHRVRETDSGSAFTGAHSLCGGAGGLLRLLRFLRLLRLMRLMQKGNGGLRYGM